MKIVEKIEKIKLKQATHIGREDTIGLLLPPPPPAPTIGFVFELATTNERWSKRKELIGGRTAGGLSFLVVLDIVVSFLAFSIFGTQHFRSSFWKKRAESRVDVCTTRWNK